MKLGHVKGITQTETVCEQGDENMRSDKTQKNFIMNSCILCTLQQMQRLCLFPTMLGYSLSAASTQYWLSSFLAVGMKKLHQYYTIFIFWIYGTLKDE